MFRIRFLTAGESHGPELVTVLENLPAGLPLAVSDIEPDLARRRGVGPSGLPYAGASARMAVEQDRPEIIAGVMAGITTGAPVAVRMANLDHANWKGRAVAPTTVPRPGHADLAAALKFGYEDLRFGSERASARETAARVAAGSICRRLLAEFGISVTSAVTAIGAASNEDSDRNSGARSVSEAGRFHAEIRSAAREGETLGGVFEVIARGIPPGLGTHQHWDRRLSGRLGGALMSIPGIKGAEIGEAFENARRRGSQVHDAIGPGLARATNNAGGLEGGITNGQALVVRAAMKPMATTRATMPSLDLATGEVAAARYERSDVCAVPRAAVVGEAMVCLVLADALLEKLGGDSIAEMRPRFEALRRVRLEDVPVTGREWRFWE
ncbi:MAG: chorismate synthase [Vicinamibacterales bacterium]